MNQSQRYAVVEIEDGGASCTMYEYPGAVEKYLTTSHPYSGYWTEAAKQFKSSYPHEPGWAMTYPNGWIFRVAEGAVIG